MEHHGQDGVELHFAFVDLDHRLALLASLNFLGLLDERLLVQLILKTVKLEPIEDDLQVHHIHRLDIRTIGLSPSDSPPPLALRLALFCLLSAVPLLLRALFQWLGLMNQLLHRYVTQIKYPCIDVHETLPCLVSSHHLAFQHSLLIV